ncbi:hypothetical protein OROGR_031238 [Orobanche gracilis]
MGKSNFITTNKYKNLEHKPRRLCLCSQSFVPAAALPALTVTVTVTVTQQSSRQSQVTTLIIMSYSTTTTITSTQQTNLVEANSLYLPGDCWESVLKIIIGDDNNNRCYLKSLSLVSKQFLSITNRLKYSLAVCNVNIFPYLLPPSLPRILQRFTNLTSLDLWYYIGDLDDLLLQLSLFPLKLTSLDISNKLTIPTIGLRAFSQNITTLTSLTCSKISCLRSTDFLLIALCFPLLEELDLSNPGNFKHNCINSLHPLETLSLALPKLRKIGLSGHTYIDDTLFFHLLNNCKFLKEAIIFGSPLVTVPGFVSALHRRPTLTEGLPLKKLVLCNCTGYTYDGIYSLVSKCQYIQHLDLQKAEFLNDHNVDNLSMFLGNLVYINLNACCNLTELTLLALVRRCPLLNEISMTYTGVGKMGLDLENCSSLINFIVNPQTKLKSLLLPISQSLTDKTIRLFSSICPNLELLEVSLCCHISEGIVDVLRSCREIVHLNLSSCTSVNLHGLNFQLPKLEVLNLCNTKTIIDDEILYLISRSCCGLLKLYLRQCDQITDKGVGQVIETCERLRDIHSFKFFQVKVDLGTPPSLNSL